MKHTKGPWMIERIEGINPDLNIISGNALLNGVSNRNYLIAECYWHRDRMEEHKANAKLIASAPELLEALGEVLNNVNDPDSDFNIDYFLQQRIEALIQKATV